MLAVILAAMAAAAAPAASVATADDLNEFGLVCYCSSRVATPHFPISLDNNGRILFLTRTGITRGDLVSAGVRATESQIQLLKDWGLLTEQQGLLQTAFPVLEPTNMEALRARLSPIVGRLVASTSRDAELIVAEVRRRGAPNSAYATLFSYVLDGLVWEQLEREGKLPAAGISIERPYWAGTFWAVYPKQDNMPGTNSRKRDRAELRMLWTPTVIDTLRTFQGSPPATGWIDAVNAGEAMNTLFGKGGPAILVVREDESDPIHVHGLKIADAVAAEIGSAELAGVLPHADQGQRILIATHELIWMLLAELSQKIRVSPPEALASGASAEPDLAPLIIGVVHPPGPAD